MIATVASNLRAQTPFLLLVRMEYVVFVELDLAVLVQSEGPRLSTTVSPHLCLEKCSQVHKARPQGVLVTVAEMEQLDTTQGVISRQRAKYIFEYPHQ